MKKLMIAAAVVLAAVASQAATASWGSGVMYKANDKDGNITAKTQGNKVAGTAMSYVWITDAKTYEADSKLTTAQLFAKYITANAELEDYGADLSKSIAIAGTTLSKDVADGSTEEPKQMYSVWMAVDTTTAAAYEDVDAFVIAQVIAKEWKDTTGPKATMLGGQGNTAWTPVTVPEPTSGLLLLLGVAGLALRRRRA